jgi:hypothetical protein
MRSNIPAAPVLLPADEVPIPELLAAWVVALTTAFGFGLYTGTYWACFGLLLMIPPVLVKAQ